MGNLSHCSDNLSHCSDCDCFSSQPARCVIVEGFVPFYLACGSRVASGELLDSVVVVYRAL